MLAVVGGLVGKFIAPKKLIIQAFILELFFIKDFQRKLKKKVYNRYQQENNALKPDLISFHFKIWSFRNLEYLHSPSKYLPE